MKSTIIKQIFEILKQYIKEANILINDKGLKLSTMNTSETVLTHLVLNAENFDEFYFSNNEIPCIVGIDVIMFHKIIKSTNRKDIITLYCTTEEPDILGVNLTNTFNGVIKSFKLPILKIQETVHEIPPIDFDYIIRMQSSQFQQIVKDMDLLECENVDIKSVEKQLVFECSDGLTRFKAIVTEIENEDEKRELIKEDIKYAKFEKFSSDVIVQGQFNLKYLLFFIKASHLDDTVNILLSNDKPVVLEYHVAKLGSLKFLLSPNDS